MCACAPAGRGDRGPCLCSQPRACSGQRGSWLGCKASGYPCLEQNQAGAGPGGLRQSCPFRPPTMHSPLVAQPPAPTPSPAAPELPFGVSGGARHWGALLGVWLCAALPHRATPIQARTPRHPPHPAPRACALFPTRTSLGGGPGGGLSLGPLSPVRDLEDSCPLLTLESLC